MSCLKKNITILPQKCILIGDLKIIWDVPEELFLLDKRFFKKNIKVLDMGCGPAISIKKILDETILNNISYTGVDISASLLKFARKGDGR